VIIKEHSKIQEVNKKFKGELFKLKNNNTNLEHELNIKQGQIKYLKRRRQR
jgi:hypothetical protein